MSDASKKDKSKAPKVFDVAKPSESTPASTGKPIIVTSRPVIRDPVTEDSQEQSTDVEPAAGSVPSPTSSRVKIMPLSDPETLKQAAATNNGDLAASKPADPSDAETQPEAEASAGTGIQTPGPDKPVEAAAAEKNDGEAAEPASQSPAEDTTKEDSDQALTGSDSKPPVDSASEQDDDGSDDTEQATGEGKDISKEEEEAARKEAEREEELRKLVESRKYYLPIDEVEKRHRMYAWSTLLVLLLGLLWLDIVLDAGIMKIGDIKAPTHFFSGQQPAVASPAATTKLYVSTADHTSFSYPNTWKLSKATDNGAETIGISPVDPATSVSANLTRNQPLSATALPAGQATLADVTYQKLASSNGSVPLYLQQFIAATPQSADGQQTQYVICYNITDAQPFKSGDTVDRLASVLGQTFLSPNGKDTLSFYGYLTAPAANASAFANLNDAENFVKTNQNYKQLMVIMRSLKLPSSISK